MTHIELEQQLNLAVDEVNASRQAMRDGELEDVLASYDKFVTALITLRERLDEFAGSLRGRADFYDYASDRVLSEIERLTEVPATAKTGRVA